MDFEKIEQKAYNAGYKDGERDAGAKDGVGLELVELRRVSRERLEELTTLKVRARIQELEYVRQVQYLVDMTKERDDYRNAHGILNQNGLELQDQLAKRYSDLRLLAQYAAHKKDCGIFDERVDCTCDYPYELVADILETAGCFFEDWDDTTVPATCRCTLCTPAICAWDARGNQESCPQFRDALNWSASDYLPKVKP